MTIIYLRDENHVFTEAREVNELQPIPPMAVLVPPPQVTEPDVPIWNGDGWLIGRRPEPVSTEWYEPVPEEVEGWQAEVAMKATPVDPEDSESQNVWDRVQDLITAMPDGIEKITAQTVLARGKIRRDSPMLAQLAPLVPLSEERVDDLMRLAASIQA